MKSHRLIVILTSIVILAAPLIAQEAQRQPLYAIDLSSLVPQGTLASVSGTIAFLTDRTVAVGMCSKAMCNLATFDLANGKPHQIGQMNGTARFRAIVRTNDGGVLLAGVREGREKGTVHLDQDLHESEWIPKVPGVSVSGEKIPEGRGRLLAHATNMAAYLDEETVQIQGSDGKLLGSFKVRLSRGKSAPTMSFLGNDRILLNEGGTPVIRDFNGMALRTLKKPGRALGEKTKQSADGSRLLFDSFTRRVGPVQTITDDAIVLPTMGMSSDGDTPNGEMVRVIDTTSGKRCFQWYGVDRLLPPFADHADVNPSGRLVAIMTQGTLAVFELPDICATR
jgi:hypothetical protein